MNRRGIPAIARSVVFETNSRPLRRYDTLRDILDEETRVTAKAPPQRVLAITGAGISAESGIPTFRGKGGYWRNLEATKLATLKMFNRDPGLVWRWYLSRRRLIAKARPNAAHRALAKLAVACPQFLLVAQNVDDLDRRAGMPAEKLVQIHGDIFSTYCRNCGHRSVDRSLRFRRVPRCPECDANVGPGVVWFDEDFAAEQKRRLYGFLRSGPCEVVLVIGTSVAFKYVARWARRAKGTRGALVEVNPVATPLSPFADRTLREPAARALPKLVEEFSG